MNRIDYKKIRQMREQAGMTQEQFAARIGMTGQGISNIERGLKSPSANSLILIAEELGCKVDDLVQKDRTA